MFRFLDRLARRGPQPLLAPRAEDAEEALAALLVRLAQADNAYGEDERIHIEMILRNRRGLGHDEARALLARAEAIEAGAPDTVRFTRMLKEKIAPEDRIGVIEALWEVALADDIRAAEEEALIRLAARLLGVSDRDSAHARQRVVARSR